MTNTTVKIIIRNTVAIARSRGVKWMGTTMLLHALRNSFSEAGRILRYDAGLTDEDTREGMERFDNVPLKDGEKPRFTPKTLALIEWNADSPLALLRAIQRTNCNANTILREHGLLPSDGSRSGGQVERAAEAGYFLSARSYFSYGNLKAWDKVKQTSKEKWREWARLMLEATLNGTEEPC